MSKSGNRPNVFPALKYQNANQAIDFLVKAFGFEKSAVHEGDGDGVAHAELKLGAGTVMLGSDAKNPENPWDAVRIGIYVQVDDIDAHHARAKAAGAKIVRPHSSLGYLTPAEFVAKLKENDAASVSAKGRNAAVRGASALRPVASPSRKGHSKGTTEASDLKLKLVR